MGIISWIKSTWNAVFGSKPAVPAKVEQKLSSTSSAPSIPQQPAPANTQANPPSASKQVTQEIPKTFSNSRPTNCVESCPYADAAAQVPAVPTSSSPPLDPKDLSKRVILMNEISANDAARYRLSFAGEEMSGWSTGWTQIDYGQRVGSRNELVQAILDSSIYKSKYSSITRDGLEKFLSQQGSNCDASAPEKKLVDEFLQTSAGKGLVDKFDTKQFDDTYKVTQKKIDQIRAQNNYKKPENKALREYVDSPLFSAYLSDRWNQYQNFSTWDDLFASDELSFQTMLKREADSYPVQMGNPKKNQKPLANVVLTRRKNLIDLTFSGAERESYQKTVSATLYKYNDDEMLTWIEGYEKGPYNTDTRPAELAAEKARIQAEQKLKAEKKATN